MTMKAPIIILVMTFILGFAAVFYMRSSEEPYSSSALEPAPNTPPDAITPAITASEPSRISNNTSAAPKRAPANREAQHHTAGQTSSLDYANTLREALQMEHSGDREERIYELLESWANEDPRASYEWLLAQGDTEENRDYASRILEIYLKNDIDAAGDLVLNHVNNFNDRGVMEQYSYELSQEDPQRALHWSYGVADQKLRQAAQNTALNAWVENSPRDALDSLNEFTDLNAQELQEVASTASQIISNVDPEGMADTISRYAPSVQAEIAYGVATSWSRQNSAKAKNWIEQLNSGETKDRAIAGYVNSRTFQSPVDAFALAEQAYDENTRKNLISEVFTNWYSKSPSDAEKALLASNSLDEASKRELLANAGNN